MHALFTRDRAEAWRAANATPAPTELRAFLQNDPRPLPAIPTPSIDAGARKLALYFLGAVAFGVIGWLCH